MATDSLVPAATAADEPHARLWRIVAGALLVLYMAVTVSAALLGDDALITLRTVDNWTSGHGLRWNVAHRVQNFTHPLWMLVIAAVYASTRNAY